LLGYNFGSREYTREDIELPLVETEPVRESGGLRSELALE